jgi:hypothetical protein
MLLADDILLFVLSYVIPHGLKNIIVSKCLNLPMCFRLFHFKLML